MNSVTQDEPKQLTSLTEARRYEEEQISSLNQAAQGAVCESAPQSCSIVPIFPFPFNGNSLSVSFFPSIALNMRPVVEQGVPYMCLIVPFSFRPHHPIFPLTDLLTLSALSLFFFIRVFDCSSSIRFLSIYPYI